MSTFLHGVGSVQFLDKSGELVDLKGLDITSLAKTGVINYEHLSTLPAQLVGKILKAKKIFSKDDCSDEHQLHFWNKVKTPYLYIMAELLDDYCDSAKHVAGVLRYDRDRKDQNEYAIMWFSVEGSEIPGSRANKQTVSRGIARKVTLTSAPCNQGCAAEILENQKPQIKDDFEEIFKSEENAIALFKSGEGAKIYEKHLAKKEEESLHVMPVSSKDPKTFGQRPKNNGLKIGTTSTGKDVHSHGHVGSYGFNSAEHKEAGEFHRKAAVESKSPKLADNHIERMKLHNQAALTAGHKESRLSDALAAKKKSALSAGKEQMKKSEKTCKLHKVEGPAWSAGRVSGDTVHYSHPEHGTVSIQKQPSGSYDVKHQGKLAGVGGIKGSFSNPKEAGAHAKKYMSAVSQKKILAPKMQNISSTALMGKAEPELKKALEAGSTNAAPSTLVNGAAYQRESLSSVGANTGAEEHKFHGTKKKDWKKRANQDYDNWPHREKFEKFMKARMPHLAEGEIRAIGKTLALKKSINLEKSLESLISFDKLGKEHIKLAKSEKDYVSMSKSEAISKELDEKSLEKIQEETGKKWGDRAEEAYSRAIEQKSIKWFMDANEYHHEAIEHAGLSENIEDFKQLHAKLMPLRKEALKLLIPDSK